MDNERERAHRLADFPACGSLHYRSLALCFWGLDSEQTRRPSTCFPFGLLSQLHTVSVTDHVIDRGFSEGRLILLRARLGRPTGGCAGKSVSGRHRHSRWTQLNVKTRCALRPSGSGCLSYRPRRRSRGARTREPNSWVAIRVSRAGCVCHTSRNIKPAGLYEASRTREANQLPHARLDCAVGLFGRATGCPAVARKTTDRWRRFASVRRQMEERCRDVLGALEVLIPWETGRSLAPTDRRRLSWAQSSPHSGGKRSLPLEVGF